jgi:hypothetical protein
MRCSLAAVFTPHLWTIPSPASSSPSLNTIHLRYTHCYSGFNRTAHHVTSTRSLSDPSLWGGWSGSDIYRTNTVADTVVPFRASFATLLWFRASQHRSTYRYYRFQRRNYYCEFRQIPTLCLGLRGSTARTFRRRRAPHGNNELDRILSGFFKGLVSQWFPVRKAQNLY